MSSFNKLFSRSGDLALVALLTILSLETIEHHFCERASTWEVPDFVHVLNEVTSIDSFLQFRVGRVPTRQPLSLSVDAMVTAFGQRFGLLFFHAGTTEGKHQFSTTAIG